MLPLVLLAAVAMTAVAAPAFAARCDAHAAELVEPALLSSPLHTLDPCVAILGHMARFTLNTDFGRQSVDSIELLRIRVDELPAIAALERTSSALFAMRAAGAQAYGKGATLARVAAHPIATATGLPRGVLRFFQQRYEKYALRLGKLSGRARDEFTDADGAYDVPSTRPGVVALRGAGSKRNAAQKVGREARRHALDYVSYKATRRKWARRLGLDPYTSNPLIKVRLDRLAWAAVAGEQAADLAFATLPTSMLDALDTARDLETYVLDLPPEDVRRRNAARLADLGCGEVESSRLLHRGPYSPVLLTQLVDALEQLAPQSGCVDVVQLAAAAVEGELEARYVVNALQLLAASTASAPRQAARRLELAGTAIVLREGADPLRATMTLPLAVDRLQWTPSTRSFFDHQRMRVPDKTVLVARELSDTARRALSRRGWSIVENAAGQE